MSEPVCLLDFENFAKSKLSKPEFDYYAGGAGRQETLALNREAYSQYKIRPRCLRNVKKRQLTTTILGRTINIPIGISPTAIQKMAHPDGECGSAKAAEAMGTIFILSTASNYSLEEVARKAPNCIKWLQLFIYKNREITKSLVDRAEKFGFTALVLTVDTPLIGRRLADIKNKFKMPEHLRFGNFENIQSGMNDKSKGDKVYDSANAMYDPSLQWRDIAWLKSITRLPIVLKGILTAEDALLAVEAGVDAILVSNHGARQLDSTPATIEVLPEIVKAVGDRLEIYVDGGITDGTDVFKAIALGAKMVFLGRHILWGLAFAGEDGVKKVLEILAKEFDYAMAISGCDRLEQIAENMVVHKSFYSKI